MVQTRRKGNRIRLMAKKELEGQGYWVDTVEKTSRFAYPKDCFGVADLIAIKCNVVLFVQVTANRPHYDKKYQEFADRFCGTNFGLQQWVWMDRVGFKKIYYG